MKHSPFDPKKAVTFDLANGQVRLGDDTAREVIVPASALAAVVAAAGDAAAEDLGRAIGRPLGLRVAARMKGAEQVRAASIDAIAGELAAELAMIGMGELGFERWGHALLAVVNGSPFGTRASERLVASIIEGMLVAATGRDLLRTLPLARSGDQSRILVANVAAIERVIGWLATGMPWGEALTRLHAPRPEASA